MMIAQQWASALAVALAALFSQPSFAQQGKTGEQDSGQQQDQAQQQRHSLPQQNGVAQTPMRRNLAPGVESVVEPEILVQERRANPGIYGLELAHKQPRFITVQVPDAAGKLQSKQYWYLVYRVTNRTGQPRLFVPELTLVCTDTGRHYMDTVVPAVQKAVAQREDPALTWENSATIAGMVPVTPEQGPDVSVYGIAVWEGVDPETDFFSVYVSGLSNGYRISEAENRTQRILRKTLKLNFWRPGDEFFEREKEIRPISKDALRPGQETEQSVRDYEWVYR